MAAPTITSATQTLIATVVLCIAVGCGAASPVSQPPSSPSADAASEDGAASTAERPTPAAPPTGGADDFGSTLQGKDLAAFRALPVEFQEALRQESRATDADAALRLLRELPQEPLPITDSLEPVAQGWFKELAQEHQRYLLLQGYGGTHRSNLRLGGDLNQFKFMFQHMVELAFDGRAELPPMEQALSADALNKLEVMATPLARAFRLAWRKRGLPPSEVDPTVERLERALLAAPLAMPPLEALGLSDASVGLFHDLPDDVQAWLWREAAADLALRGELGSTSYMRDEYIQTLSARGAVEPFKQGIIPALDSWFAGWTFACGSDPSRWPQSVEERMPQGWDNLPAVFLPPYEATLAPEALARLRELDARLTAAFEARWEAGGPYSPRDAFCEISMLERGLLYIPLTTAPETQDILSQEFYERYQSLNDEARGEIDRQIADSIVYGVVMDFETGDPLLTFNTPLDVYLDGARREVEETIMIWARE